MTKLFDWEDNDNNDNDQYYGNLPGSDHKPEPNDAISLTVQRAADAETGRLFSLDLLGSLQENGLTALQKYLSDSAPAAVFELVDQLVVLAMRISHKCAGDLSDFDAADMHYLIASVSNLTEQVDLLKDDCQ